MDRLDSIPAAVRQEIDAFAAANPFVSQWARYPDVSAEMDETMPACEQMSEAFARFVDSKRFDTVEVIEADLSTHPEADYHRWTRLRTEGVSVNVDWTARQYHNLEWDDELQDFAPAYSDLPCPLVWVGEGPQHPVVEFTRQKLIEIEPAQEMILTLPAPDPSGQTYERPSF